MRVGSRLSLNGISFLIVDDSTYMRSVIRAVLLGMGSGLVYEAKDGASGLERVLDYRPDIVICDWVMAPVNGEEFMQHLRGDKDPGISTTPVIMLTSFTKRAYVMKAVRLGVNEFLAKPISPLLLYQRIERIVTEARPFVRVPGYFGPIPRGTTADEKTLSQIAAVMAKPMPAAETLSLI